MNSRYVVLESFELVADAEILRLKLESEGIPVFLKDANIMQAQPFTAAATGGVKVMVEKEDFLRANAVYDGLRRFALDKHGNPVVCPNCKAARSERHFMRKTLRDKLFPFLEPPKYRCTQCGMITKGHS
ncbi:DUF2007 domain-containing protein [Robiginitalea sp. SC105]|uniref:DUF2007 domain-containing protein n=1 Tax=Robiginitalea sp. SC105 TaxID=2762332 RepID=UPI00163B1DA2|nr:DUF2007 domain-containing protein [Robiginitalea sp. SC105]MBC2837974.1 DUF2007 domain-containing protein [Robiginitalea sp. SC105]